MKYIPLNIKTEYELLNSLIKIDELVLYAKENNINALGITDTNMFSCIEFYKSCKKNNIKPIVGVELVFNEREFLLYARNYCGYVNLCNIISENNINELTIEYLNEKKSDLICVSSLYDYEYLSKIFDIVYIRYFTKKQKTEAILVSKNIVYMNKVLALTSEDTNYIKYANMIKTGETIDCETNYDYTDNYLIEPTDSFDIETTINFSNLIDFEIEKQEFKLPVFNDDSINYLRSLCKKGLEKRLNGKVDETYKNRLLYELSVIESMGFVDYFLIVYDFILYAKKKNILVGPGRGSAAGSLVSYSLGITEIDPIKYNLIFERFLNPDRISLPDIDTDFDDERRDEVIEYVKEKYGHEHVANIITFGTLLPKQVIRDVGRILNMDIKDLDRICKTILNEPDFYRLKYNREFISLAKDIRYKELLNISKHLVGLKRHQSIHAAGIVLSSIPLRDRIPLYNSSGAILTGYTMYHLEDLGLLKMDFLGIRNLNTIGKVISDIEANLNIKIDINKIPLDDEASIELFRQVNTVGIFQFESSGMKNFLNTLKINNFNEIVDAIALYRPGPREMIPDYIKRRNGLEKISYVFPELEIILKDTYGIMIYQEQLLEVLRVIAGFSYSEADNIRRAMSKKIESVILHEKENFINSSIRRGHDKNKTIELFNLILKFANYGFNKSHSVSYSIIAYQMAYLKAHYPTYFMKHLLDMVIGSEIKTKEYMDESKILGITFLGININISTEKYNTCENCLILPLNTIKSMGIISTKEIIEERNKGMFTSLYDFCIRMHNKSINKKILTNLIISGAFDEFKINKKSAIDSLDAILDYSKLCNELDRESVLEPDIEEIEDYNENEIMELENEIFGFYLSNHPVIKYKRDNMVKLNEIHLYFDKYISVIAYVESIKSISTKKNDKMAFITISDEYSKVESVVFPKSYSLLSIIKKGDIILLRGKVEKREGNYQIIINGIEKK